jgi:hypothetical protein
MASSQIFQISTLARIINETQAKSVLDIGTGRGKYGVLAREYLTPIEYAKDNSGLRIVGVEGYAEYVTPLHDYIYDETWVGNVFNMQEKLKGFDIVLLIDVLEHFSRNAGEKLLKQLVRENKTVLISTPKYVGVQEDEANQYQQHQSQWSRSDLTRLGGRGESFVAADAISHIVLVGDRELIARVRRHFRTTWFKHTLAFIPGLNWLYRKLLWKKAIAHD